MVFCCHFGNSVEKTAVILSHLYVIGLKIVLREDVITLKVVIITNLGQRKKISINAENTTDLPETLQVPSLCCFS